MEPRGDDSTIGLVTPAQDEAGGLYGPLSEAWRLGREAMLLLGAGPRALLMQIAHPLIAEGVDQHSNFRTDPWGRLRSTLQSSFDVVYGSRQEAIAEIRRINALHRRISGPVVDPLAREVGSLRYEARDPDLLLWVHATLIDSTLVTYEAWIGPLSEERRAAYYAETRPIGRAFGIPDDLLPADLAGFQAYLGRMLEPDGPIRVTPTARALAETILHPPRGAFGALGRLVPVTLPAPILRLSRAIDRIPPAAYDWTIWPSLALLPERLRAEFEIPWTDRRRLASAWLTLGFRLWRPLIPVSLRWMPQALAADRRLNGAGHRLA